ncbi:MAG: GNAT family N-acetyltransferase [Vicinamibacterales bacterium]
MMLGIRGLPGTHPPRLGEDCYLAVVEDGDDIAACSVRTPPFGAIITRAELPTLECLAEDLAAKYKTLPAVLGPEPAVSTFANLWSRRAGTRWRPLMRMRLFVARQVQSLSAQPPGGLRIAVESDLPTVIPWAIAFHREARTGTPLDPAQTIREDVINQRLVVWDDGGAVSMATWAGRSDRSVRIGTAYTPPDHRRHGYASACVAALTQCLLDDGVTFCCINTDLTNATTNKIYPAIGYRPVCDISNIALQDG